MNLLSPLPEPDAGERVDALLTRSGLRIERIVSRGQASPAGFWYDQTEAEWVVVLAGAARLRFEDEAEARRLEPGDWVDIAPHRRHRVDWTDPVVPTVWLAVFYRQRRPGRAPPDTAVFRDGRENIVNKIDAGVKPPSIKLSRSNA